MELEHIIENVIPVVIHILEIMGLCVIIFAALKAFAFYVKSAFDFSNRKVKIELSEALALALEFKLGGEILKTVIVRTTDELIILASVVILRAIITFIINWEIKCDSQHCSSMEIH